MKKKAFFGNSNKGELQVKKGSHGLIAGGPNIEIAKTDATIYNESPTYFKLDVLVKSQKSSVFVIPAKAGIQEYQVVMDPRFRGGDGLGDFLRIHHV